MTNWKRTLAACLAAAVLAGHAVAQQAFTENEIAASPAAQKLRQMLDAITSGEEAIQAFAAANPRQQASAQPEDSRLYELLHLRRASRGYTLLRFARVTPTEAEAAIRNLLSGDLESVLVRVEAEPPHRIRGYRIGADMALQTGTAPLATDEERVREVAAYTKRLADADYFSGTVLIAKEGKPIFEQAYGFADRERRIPNRIDTRFRLASLNKMITALAIGRLVEQGKLSYEDPLSKFVPDYPDRASAQKIRVKHLLSHTSGLGDAHDFLQSAQFWANVGKVVDVPSTLAVAGRAPLEFEPGTRWNYSNTGFVLLGRIIEIVTGQDYFAHLAGTMFRPLRLASTGFPHFDADRRIALPYETRLTNDGKLELAVAKERTRRGGPAGDAASNVHDLLRFAEAVRTGRVVSQETLRLLSKRKPELQSPFYGYGMSQDFPGRDIYGHGGGGPGICTELGIIRDTPSPYTVVVLGNSQAACKGIVSKIFHSFRPPAQLTP
ncbi:MAG TPA: serine hydrolase domain-containing protein [Thermoanaerobaculia bacterium]|nr:serine hydrolase domain-containing protein [Thermoanaerobaculia bacterium]